MPDEDETVSIVRPGWDELLPSASDRTALEDASAALEAGRFVRRLRTAAGLTQSQLAARLAVSQARISAVETGEGRDGPGYALLKRIVSACGREWSLETGLVTMPVEVQLGRPERRPRPPAAAPEDMSPVEDVIHPGWTAAQGTISIGGVTYHPRITADGSIRLVRADDSGGALNPVTGITAGS